MQDNDKMYANILQFFPAMQPKRQEAEILSDTRAKEVFVDLGYRGVDLANVKVYKARQKRGINTWRLKRALKRRNAIEPVIGHLKNDGLLLSNSLKGELGDAKHAPVRRRPQHPLDPPTTPDFLP